MRVGILTDGFNGWGGGIDFIRHMLSYLETVQAEDSELKKILILPKEDLLKKFKSTIYPYRNLIKNLLVGKGLVWKESPGFSSIYVEKAFNDFSLNTEIVFGASNLRSQLLAALQAKVDVVFPCMSIPPKSFYLPWVGYIFDFQHYYFPEFFSKTEIQSRNKAFSQMLNTAKNIVVYGEEVIRDAEKFYPGHKAKLHALPFSPCPQPSWLLDTPGVKEKYHIDKPYFLISNQFWRHKDHVTAFHAFGKYATSGGKADLVCTGATQDYRFPEYFSQLLKLIEELNLRDKVKILGHISKQDQISLMRDSLAVIQPTLFEGGPGGGSSYDAISLGIPVIASDIPINREMTCDDVTFFSAGNVEKLAEILLAWGLSSYHRKANDELLSRGRERKRIAGCVLKNILSDAVKEGG